MIIDSLPRTKVDEIQQYAFGTDHIVVRFEVSSKLLKLNRRSGNMFILVQTNEPHNKYGTFPVPVWKPNRLSKNVQGSLEDMIKASIDEKYVYVFHIFTENMWGFIGTSDVMYV